jgi:hypothetical protein
MVTAAVVVLLVLLVGVILTLARRPVKKNFRDRIPEGFDTARLPSPQHIIGRWVEDDGWIDFAATGRMSVRYGDVIYSGTYRVSDNQAMDTNFKVYGQEDRIHHWKVGIYEGELVMVDYESQWVFRYKRAGPGTVE